MDVDSWAFRARDYERERVTLAARAEGVAGDHPLLLVKKKKKATASAPSSKSSGKQQHQIMGKDPLSSSSGDPLSDPLSMLIDASPPRKEEEEEPLVVPQQRTTRRADAAWTVAKTAMLRDFGGEGAGAALQLSKELSSGARPLPKKSSKTDLTFDGDDESRLVRSTTAPKLVERSAARLRHLQQEDKSSSVTANNSEFTFAQTAERIFAQLRRAWSNDERVLALKLAIQAAKTLQSSKDKTYPAVFVLATDILDAFGTYVFERIEEKKMSNGISDAKETCRNWFYKTSCVREVLPRYYVEVALVKCYVFLSPDDLPKILARLGHIARGLGDPVVAAYARAYLARVGRDVFSKHGKFSLAAASGDSSSSGSFFSQVVVTKESSSPNFVVAMLQDFLFTFQAVPPEEKKAFLKVASPALSWLAECCQFMTTLAASGSSSSSSSSESSTGGAHAAHASSSKGGGDDSGDSSAAGPLFDAVLAQYRDYCNDATVLLHVVDAFEPKRVSERAAALVTLAKRAEPSEVSTVALLGKLGSVFSKAPPPKHHRLPVLNEVWKVVAKCNDLADYVDCATHWLDCLLKHYSDREVEVLLNDVVSHVEAAVARGDLQVKTSTTAAAAAGNATTTTTTTGRPQQQQRGGGGPPTTTAAGTTTSTSGGEGSSVQKNGTTAKSNEEVQPPTQKQQVAAQRLEDLVQMLVESCGKKRKDGKSGESSVVLASDHLLKLLDLFRPHRKVEIAKELLAGACSSSSATTTTTPFEDLRRGGGQKNVRRASRFRDPVLIHTVLEIARVAHDSLDSLSPEGERKHVASLILGFVDRVDVGRDLERQLGIYVECRAAFPNLDAVLDRLVCLTATLAIDAKRLVGRSSSASSSKRSSSSKAATDRATNFAKACLAYCHVTIPSINGLFRRFDLLILLGHVALVQACLPHADTFFKAAVALVPDLPRNADGRADDPEEEEDDDTTVKDADGTAAKKVDPSFFSSDKAADGEARLVKAIQKFAGSLVVVPGRPDHGPFYLVQGLLNALPRYKFWQPRSGKRVEAYLALIPLLAAFAQRSLPYSTPDVEANDVLYGGEPEYGTQVKTHLAAVVSRIVVDLTDLAKAQDHDPDVRATRVLDFVNVIHAHFDFKENDSSDKDSASPRAFAAKLVGLVQNKVKPNAKLHKDTLAYLDATATLVATAT